MRTDLQTHVSGEMTSKPLVPFALAIGLILPGAAHSQIATPEPINTPVRAEWREPFEGFFRALGIREPSATLAKTHAMQIDGIFRRSILLRIEDAPFCWDDLCFTAIGRVVDNRFAADATLFAGKGYTVGDAYISPRGMTFQTLPRWLIGNTVTVSLIETPQGWIVIPRGPRLP
jgi:hypothetical protein